MPRSTEFSQVVADHICEQIAAGRCVAEICKDDGMPVPSTVFKWLTQQPTFADEYTRAREVQSDLMDQLILEAASAPPERVTIQQGENRFKESVDTGEVQHRRLKIDALKWRAAHLRPKVYGVQRSEVEHTGKLTLEQILSASEKPAEDGHG